MLYVLDPNLEYGCRGSNPGHKVGNLGCYHYTTAVRAQRKKRVTFKNSAFFSP